VHRATTLDGDEIVLKIQYPGVAQSIDSDVDNIASLLKLSNLLPKHMDISELLVDAKKQLHEEADYLREAEYLASFHDTLKDQPAFKIPKPYPELSTDKILAMEYVEGEDIESVDGHVDVDQLMTHMFDLMFRELFDLKLMQTDANFANYQYQSDDNKIVLLDFGATRSFRVKFTINYKRLLRAVIAKDDQAVLAAADLLGYHATSADQEYQELLVRIFYILLEPFTFDGDYDFSKAKLSERLSSLSDDAYGFKEFWQTPPTDILFFHRKLGGLYLLATRLGAKVNCQRGVSPWLKTLR